MSEIKTIGGSFRSPQFEMYIKNRIKKLFPKRDAKVLDIGVGAGKYGIILQGLVKSIDGVEVFEETLKRNDYLLDYYDRIFIEDAVDFQRYHDYDVVIFGDVLEHITTEQAQQLLRRIYSKVREIIILVPYLYEQDGTHNNNPYEEHKQPDLTHEVFMERYPGFLSWGRNSQHGLYMKMPPKQTITPTKNKNKIAVYTITKNEEKYVPSFMDSMREADHVVVLDTGSTDRTVELLQHFGAQVYTKIYDKWRFDVGRNDALKFVPSDANICVSVDLDEVFNLGWAKNLREIWDDEVGMLRYYYVSSHHDDGSPAMVFYRDKIHLNDYDTYHWKHRIHEVLTRPDDLPIIYTDSVVCHHWQDIHKDRKSYLTLLEEEVKEYPDDIRILHLMGREYFAYKNYEKCIEVLLDMIQRCGQNYANERYNAYEYIGKSWIELGDDDEAIMAFKRSIKVAPHFRGNMLHLAVLYLKHLRLGEALKYVNDALEIKEQYLLWADDPDAWREKPYFIAFKIFQILQLPDQAQEMLDVIERINPNFELLEILKDNMRDLTKLQK